MRQHEFETALAAIPLGYSEGTYEGRLYGTTVQRSDDGKRFSLFARQLGGKDVVSFNPYRLGAGEMALRPCEMSSDKVEAFVLGYLTGNPASGEPRRHP
jgi:hypothetical protein